MNPRRVTEPRIGVALLSMTRLELVEHLRSDGWELLCVERGASTQPVPVDISDGKPVPKHIFVKPGALPFKTYLQVLAHVPKISDTGFKDSLEGG